jgi:hypothetical protein
VLIAQNGAGFEIVDGNVVAGLQTGTTDSSTVATVPVTHVANWLATGPGEGTIIPDVNGDGYPDFAIGNAVNPVPGMVAVYW